MKYSKYNIPVDVGGDKKLVFNSFRKNYSVVSSAFWDKYFQMKDFNDIEESVLSQMRENGYVVDDEFDEYALALNCKIATRLQTEVYHIIINPTLDCNLRCWYCYETHKENSCIEHDVEISVLNHLESKYCVNPFKYLRLSFFGGEPLIRSKQVCQIISDIKSFCETKKIQLGIDFTTNGTIWSPPLIKELQDVSSVSFQITLDGSADQHDKIRCFKYGGKGTYKKILENINRILVTLSNADITIRINFDGETFNFVEDLEEELLKLPLLRFKVALHKVWQIDSNTIDYEKVFDFINNLQDRGINVQFLNFSNGETTCYADKINSVVINYDGSVYKCTARNFDAENQVGKLLKTGDIAWDYSKLKEYCFASVPSRCQECQLFPTCTGICSQEIIESGDQNSCIIDTSFTIQDYILYNYKAIQILKNRNYETKY